MCHHVLPADRSGCTNYLAPGGVFTAPRRRPGPPASVGLKGGREQTLLQDHGDATSAA